MFDIKKEKIFYNGKLIFKAPWSIQSSEEYNKTLIIHYDIPPEEDFKFSAKDIYENVLCIDFNGQVKWRLPICPKEVIGPPHTPTYHRVSKAKNGNYWAMAGSYGYQFDPSTGKILKSEFTH